MRPYRLSSSLPPAWFARAAAFFQGAYAVIISRGIRSCPMLKCSSERWVCAPQSLSLGTPTSPRLSVSLRMPITDTLLIAAIVLTPSQLVLFGVAPVICWLVNASPEAGVIDEFHAAFGTAIR